jgi:CheY-like chemotaxis protein
VDLRSQVPTGLPKVSGDPNQMHQVFFNVILNAVQAMPHGGSLLIDARIVSGDDGKARMEVLFEDTGVGIPQEQLNRIFDPFFSNRRGSTVGTGLGLSVSMSMVRGMDGDIRVDSEVGRGTTMTVTLPIIERRRRPRHGEKPKTRILVVDDEPNIRRTLSTFLGRRGYHVVAARDGREAMEILEDPEAVFGLAVVDLLMPRMSGLETIHAMRAARPHMPAVILTGVANTEELAQVEELGIARHLRKPVDFDLLTRTVEELAGPADAPVPVEV